MTDQNIQLPTDDIQCLTIEIAAHADSKRERLACKTGDVLFEEAKTNSDPIDSGILDANDLAVREDGGKILESFILQDFKELKAYIFAVCPYQRKEVIDLKGDDAYVVFAETTLQLHQAFL